METIGLGGGSRCSKPTQFISTATRSKSTSFAPLSSPSLIQAMATQKKPSSSSSASTKPSYIISKKEAVTTVGRSSSSSGNNSSSTSIRLLTRVEQLRLLTKAEKAGLLSAAEKLGLSLSSIEKSGLLSKAEELGVLSTATDPGTPGLLLSLSFALLVFAPVFVYLVPEEYTWEVVLQVVVSLVCVVGGSAAFAASNFVSNLQKSA